MEYPIIIDGAEAGRLSVTVDGLFTVFEANAEPREGLVRLSVYGGGREGYLGVMQPWSGGLYLRRRMSRRECAALPQEIEYAGIAFAAEAVRAPSPAPPAECTSECTDDTPPAPEAEPVPSPAAPQITDDAEALLWFSRPDGTLTAFDGRGCIVAIPAELRRRNERAVLREIGGTVYMLFRY